MLTSLTSALSYYEQLPLAAALGVGTTGLLSLKLEMHTFARRLTRADGYATLKFAVVTATILSVMPNQAFGPPPFNVLNLYQILLMAVFICWIRPLGHVLVKMAGPQKGVGLVPAHPTASYYGCGERRGLFPATGAVAFALASSSRRQSRLT